jgi:hypothetical protein|tara:strand:+ start:448 stop:1053 length:606 start_codon:yes stop_codon:yes gene_type:complete
MVTLDVTCPDGVGAGGVVSLERPDDGMQFEVLVPEGIRPGMQFAVELPDGATALGLQLTDEQTQAFQKLDAALRSHAPLTQFVEQHCSELGAYDDGQTELPLEWMSLHREFVRLVETRVEEVLGASTLGSSQALFALVAASHGSCVRDVAADTLVDKLLAIGDFAYFCGHMRALAHTQSQRRATARGYPIVGSHMPPSVVA